MYLSHKIFKIIKKNISATFFLIFSLVKSGNDGDESKRPSNNDDASKQPSNNDDASKQPSNNDDASKQPSNNDVTQSKYSKIIIYY